MSSVALSDAAVASVASAIFSQHAPTVAEAYSDPDQPHRYFRSAEKLVAYVGAHRSLPGASAHIGIHYPDMLGQLREVVITLNPAKCDGHTFRTTIEGWGIIWVYFQLSNDTRLPSRVSANSRARAEKWAPTLPDWEPPSSWNWAAVTSHCRRLTRVLKRAV